MTRNKKDVSVMITEIVNTAEDGLSSGDIHHALKRRLRDKAPGYSTLQRKLSSLANKGAIKRTGRSRAIRYWRAADTTPKHDIAADVPPAIPVSEDSKAIQEYVRRPLQGRDPVGYQRDFLEGYVPNWAQYLPDKIRTHLRNIGTLKEPGQSAGGTYPPVLVNRLLIDLSWASSRLEGNTYSLLETRNLIEAGQSAEGKDLTETTMILNHKEAIAMLLEAVQDIDFNMYTLLNLHGILSKNLLGDPNDSGRLREKIVEIGGSVYRPLGFPQQVEECFRLILDKAREIEDPFEQAFFVMVHMPYLQPFTDVNKRTARLGANIPLIKNRLCPLSYLEVPVKDYIEGMLGVYELNQTSLLQDVFVWAYERSCQQYNSVKDHSAAPDPFLLKYSQLLDSVIGEIVRKKLPATAECITGLAQERLQGEDAARFVTTVNDELQNLHEGILARYRLRPLEFIEWKQLQSTASHPDGTSSRPPGLTTNG